ncbi:RadC family protein [Thermocrinis minervae]|uniref:DNA repair protein RadC n=1 Tax=Thermocrinis minervae TaxID=381751 RepID=A0A1M6SJZ9_9AQUI|nr:DNA repair protein RadC [Thermocrinis minervae]SHK45062.1 DNA repair protein RadC [Thermocrinis minervae]
MYRRLKKLRELPEEQRPRERLINHGSQALEEAELLAIILVSGTKDLDVLSLAERILELGWENIASMSVQELSQRIKGLGLAKACQVKAIAELLKRSKDPYNGVKIRSPEDVYRFVKDKVDDRREHLIAIHLTPTHRVIGYDLVAIGRMNTLHAEPKDILYGAIKRGAYAIILVHNHPKGEARPSREDIEFTKRVKKACDIMGFVLLDHIIVTEEGYCSIRGFLGEDL